VKWILLALAFSFAAHAAEKEKALPYLGPGADKLSKADYERIYKNYIRMSILLDYPFLEGTPKPCDQALESAFRQAGLFTYPVPADAQQVVRNVKTRHGKKVESYLSGGMLLQLVRNPSGAPERLFWVNSGSTKASRRLADIMKREELTLEKDPVTGLERVKGLPVGYPHPFLNQSGQGLFVKILRFVSNRDDCRPEEFTDNAWSGGFDLNNDRCLELEGDAERVWAEKMSPGEFSERELKRLKERAMKNAMETGVKEAEARKLVEKHFVPPYTSEINVVGSAMRNLAQCKLMALGNKVRKAPPTQNQKPAISAPESGSAR
jgi:hypothetical protein